MSNWLVPSINLFTFFMRCQSFLNAFVPRRVAENERVNVARYPTIHTLTGSTGISRTNCLKTDCYVNFLLNEFTLCTCIAYNILFVKVEPFCFKIPSFHILHVIMKSLISLGHFFAFLTFWKSMPRRGIMGKDKRRLITCRVRSVSYNKYSMHRFLTQNSLKISQDSNGIEYYYTSCRSVWDFSFVFQKSKAVLSRVT